MEIIILLVVAILPPLLILRYYLNKDKAKPEPAGLKIKMFITGIIFVIPAIILEGIGDYIITAIYSQSLIYVFLKSFVIAGFIEEALKYFAVRRFVYDNRHFDEVMDGIVYTVLVSIGFATIENVFFVLTHGVQVGLLRAFTSLPLHAAASGIMGYYIGMSKFAELPAERTKLIRKGLFIAVVIHGLYDFSIFSMPYIDSAMGFMIVPILIYSIVSLRNKIRLAINEDTVSGRILNDEISFNMINNTQ